MWTCSELKRKGKVNLSGCYWKSVLAAFVLWIGVACADQIIAVIYSMIYAAGILPAGVGAWTANHMPWAYNGWDGYYFSGPSWGSGLFLAGAMISVAIAALVIRVGVSFFLCSPLEVGAQRWFIVNRYQHDASAGELVYPFSHGSRGYLNVVKGMFLRWLYTALWTLLFIIPGWVKSYSYRLVPYILAESPEMDTREAFRLSMAMMNGNKWHTFLLDLSFIGWEILNCFTLGLLDVFYVKPYRAQTNMELYIRLRDQYLGRTQNG